MQQSSPFLLHVLAEFTGFQPFPRVTQEGLHWSFCPDSEPSSSQIISAKVGTVVGWGAEAERVGTGVFVGAGQEGDVTEVHRPFAVEVGGAQAGLVEHLLSQKSSLFPFL